MKLSTSKQLIMTNSGIGGSADVSVSMRIGSFRYVMYAWQALE